MTVDQELPQKASPAYGSEVDGPFDVDFALRWIPDLGAFAVAAMLLSRALIPATHGWVVGMSQLVDVLDFAALALGHALGIVLIAAAVLLLLSLLRGRAPIVLRLAGVFLTVTAIFAVLLSLTGPRLPAAVYLLVSGAGCLAALTFGADATRRGGLVGLVPATVGLASAVRTVGAYNADSALAERHDVTTMNAAFHNAQVLTTLASGFLLVAAVVTLVVMFKVDRVRTVASFALSLALSLLVGWQVVKPVDDTDGPVLVLLRRFGQELITRPPPLFDGAATALLALLVPLVGLSAVVVARRKQPAVAGALALALLAGASAEIPLLALGLIVGAVALSIACRDPSAAHRGQRS